jgi:hypothetical protein
MILQVNLGYQQQLLLVNMIKLTTYRFAAVLNNGMVDIDYDHELEIVKEEEVTKLSENETFAELVNRAAQRCKDENQKTLAMVRQLHKNNPNKFSITEMRVTS